MRIVLLGPQGSGKGTQAKLLSQRLVIPHISTGDMFRAEIAADTPLGRKVEKILESGALVPDDVTLKVLKHRLTKSDCERGFVLDGYPRNLRQAQDLERLTKIQHAIFFRIDEAVAVRRLSARRQCRGCGQIYGEDRKPKQAGRCDACGNELYQRKDDWPDAIKQRFQLFRSETQPVINLYRQRGLLLEVNADQSVQSVSLQIREALKV